MVTMGQTTLCAPIHRSPGNCVLTWGDAVAIDVLGMARRAGYLVARHLIVTVLTPRLFETAPAPHVHRDLHVAACAAFA